MKKFIYVLIAMFVLLAVTLTGCWGDNNTVKTHKCEHVCEICGKCTDSQCTDDVCATKCPGHYTITFDVQGGTAISNKTVSKGDTVNLTEYTTTKTGYTFVDWTDSGDNHYTTEFVMPAESVTLTANWLINEYTITFDVNGGDALDSSSITADYDTAITLPTPTKTGYIFKGWFNGEIKAEYTKMPAENVTLTAKWQVKPFVITYDVNGGDALDSSTQEVVPGDAYTLVKPTRSGYRFIKWVESNSNVEVVDGIYTFGEDITLKAIWVEAEEGWSEWVAGK